MMNINLNINIININILAILSISIYFSNIINIININIIISISILLSNDRNLNWMMNINLNYKANILSPASSAASGAKTTIAKKTKHNMSSLKPSHLTPVRIRNHAEV